MLYSVYLRVVARQRLCMAIVNRFAVNSTSRLQPASPNAGRLRLCRSGRRGIAPFPSFGHFRPRRLGIRLAVRFLHRMMLGSVPVNGALNRVRRAALRSCRSWVPLPAHAAQTLLATSKMVLPSSAPFRSNWPKIGFGEAAGRQKSPPLVQLPCQLAPLCAFCCVLPPYICPVSRSATT